MSKNSNQDDGWGNTEDDGWGTSNNSNKAEKDNCSWDQSDKNSGDGGWGSSDPSSSKKGGRPNDQSGWESSNKDEGGGWGSSNKDEGSSWGTSETNKCDNSWGVSEQSSGGRGRGGGGSGARGCFNCGESGHMSRDCPAPRKQSSSGGGRGCFNCGESGHMSRDCPAPRKQSYGSGGGSGRGCFNCGESGHMSRYCPAPKKERGRGSSSGFGSSRGSSDTYKKDDGGWGSSSANNDNGGWGSSSANNDDGGWGGSSSDKKDDGNNWGSSETTTKKRESGSNGWDSTEPKDNQGYRGKRNSNDDNSSPNKKRYKPEDDNNAERPAPYKPDDLNLEEEVAFQDNEVGQNFEKYKEHTVACLPEGLIEPIEKFDDIISSKLLLENIKLQKYTDMTPIQKWAIPSISKGYDMIACAQTGSGKTAAFLLPVLQTLLKTDLEPIDMNCDRQDPYCIIISPTRELANQIYVHANMLSRDSIIKCHVIYGQIATHHLKAKLSTGCHVLVATPGRLKDFVNRGWIGFKNIKYIILDEGDRLVDEGFESDIKGFFADPSMPSKDERQTLFFSATFKQKTQVLATNYLKPEFIFLTVGRIGAANENIKQEFLQVSRQDKKRELKKILSEVPENEKTIIFTQTKNAADMLAGFFTVLNLSSTSIHGDRHQSQREQAIKAFKRGEKRFLISSPVGNRGLDLPKVSLVINYDLPASIDEYVHRIGRTGRAGHIGRAISFYDGERDFEILKDLITILTEAKQEIPDWMSGLDSNGTENNNAIEGATGEEGATMTTNASEAVEEEW